MNFDVIIIGAGAAGLFCAATAGARGRSVLVIEHADKVGKKILISGGGRCNFTNLHTEPANYLSDNPHFCKSALARYTPADFIALVNKHGVAWHEKKLGQLFCDDNARDIVNLLLRECHDASVKIRVNCPVRAVRGGPAPHLFTVETAHGLFTAASLVIAAGGLSIPKMGATGLAYDIARQYGLRVIDPQPALVPLTLQESELLVYAPLSGVSVDARVTSGKQSFRENILLTHRGLSGPAILQISSYWRPGQDITLDLLPGLNAETILRERQRDNIILSTLLAEHLPARFARAWADRIAPAKPLRQFTPAEIAAIAQKLHQWTLAPAGTEGFAKAEVTRGGVDTRALSSQTMASRAVPGLYFIGECVDVTGWLGGYNFQWAWASAHAAGQAV